MFCHTLKVSLFVFLTNYSHLFESLHVLSALTQDYKYYNIKYTITETF